MSNSEKLSISFVRVVLLCCCVVLVGLAIENLTLQAVADPTPTPQVSGTPTIAVSGTPTVPASGTATPGPGSPYPPNCGACPRNDKGQSYHFFSWMLGRTDDPSVILDGGTQTRNARNSRCCSGGADPDNCELTVYGRWGDVDVWCYHHNKNCSCGEVDQSGLASSGSSGSNYYAMRNPVDGAFGKAGFGAFDRQFASNQIHSELTQQRFYR